MSSPDINLSSKFIYNLLSMKKKKKNVNAAILIIGNEKINFKPIESKHGKTTSIIYIFENTAYISDSNDLSIVNIKELQNLKYLT